MRGIETTAAVASRWMLHYIDDEPLLITCDAPMTHAEVLELHAGCVAAEPVLPTEAQP